LPCKAKREHQSRRSAARQPGKAGSGRAHLESFLHRGNVGRRLLAVGLVRVGELAFALLECVLEPQDLVLRAREQATRHLSIAALLCHWRKTRTHGLDLADVAVDLLQLRAQLVPRLLGLPPAALDIKHVALERAEGEKGCRISAGGERPRMRRKTHSISAVRSSVKSPGLSHFSTKFIVCVPWLREQHANEAQGQTADASRRASCWDAPSEGLVERVLTVDARAVANLAGEPNGLLTGSRDGRALDEGPVDEDAADVLVGELEASRVRAVSGRVY
jgi:hypothetical protein